MTWPEAIVKITEALAGLIFFCFCLWVIAREMD